MNRFKSHAIIREFPWLITAKNEFLQDHTGLLIVHARVWRIKEFIAQFANEVLESSIGPNTDETLDFTIGHIVINPIVQIKKIDDTVLRLAAPSLKFSTRTSGYQNTWVCWYVNAEETLKRVFPTETSLEAAERVDVKYNDPLVILTRQTVGFTGELDYNQYQITIHKPDGSVPIYKKISQARRNAYKLVKNAIEEVDESQGKSL